MRTLLVQVMLACVAFVLIGDVLWRAGSLAWQHASGSTIEARGTPPPPYTDPQLTTTNALGGIGRTQGWEALVSTGGPQADLDILSDAVIPADILADVTAPSTTYFTRFVTARLACGGGSTCALSTGQAVCLRLGPATDDDPAMACTAATIAAHAAPHSNGGCYLTSLNDSCTFVLRPIQSCTSYATCHTPLYAMGAVATGLVSVSVAW